MRYLAIPVLLAAFIFPPFAASAEHKTDDGKLVVGIKHAPPFVIEQTDGSYTGITIDLWESVAEELDLDFTYRVMGLAALLTGIEMSTVDVGAAAITITSRRERLFDFSHPFYTTGLSIAVTESGSPWLSLIERVFSLEFFNALLALTGVLLLMGVLLWLFERKRNAEMFGGSKLQGIGSSFWWAAVTMTTVGYGDKAPVTLGGRIIGLIWMFGAIIIISSFTAAIATALTVGQLEGNIQNENDLYGVNVGTVAGSTSTAYLNSRNIRHIDFNNIDNALMALGNGKLDAIVYDAPLLHYYINQEHRGKLRVLDTTFNRQDYGFALPTNSKIRESVNRVVLDRINSPDWQQSLSTYLGDN